MNTGSQHWSFSEHNFENFQFLFLQVLWWMSVKYANIFGDLPDVAVAFIDSWWVQGKVDVLHITEIWEEFLDVGPCCLEIETKHEDGRVARHHFWDLFQGNDRLLWVHWHLRWIFFFLQIMYITTKWNSLRKLRAYIRSKTNKIKWREKTSLNI